MLSLLIIGQTTGDPSVAIPTLLTQIGLSGVFLWMALRSERRAEKSEERERKMHADQVALLERLVPVLTAATDALDRVQSGMERQVEYARLDPSPGASLRATLEKLIERVEDLDQRIPPPRRRGD